MRYIKSCYRSIVSLISYKIFPDYKLILLSYEGKVSFSEYKIAINDLREDKNFSIDYDVLTDMTNITESFSLEDVNTFAKFSSTLSKRDQKRLNAIVTINDLDFALSRMYEMLSEHKNPFEIKVFRNFEDALKWLKNDIPVELLTIQKSESIKI